ncbi:MAG: ABC transporter ATP-binding protein [Candidatus Sumerlaeales bacterium]|nr:ABC transporter ATP-binding protein [Candidatus Sumerlaeales bacterium]
MTPTYAIEVSNLSKRFGNNTVVDNVNLRVPQGKIYGFLGPNGSGKTTTIRLLCGLLTPDGGTGTCLGYDIRKESNKIKQQVGYMTQRFSYWEDLTVRENLMFVANVFGLAQPCDSVEAILRRFGLLSRSEQLAGTLSGGWKQRLSLAACILHSPKLLLLDEPTAGVDPQARRDFWDEIHQLARDGLTVLVSTHYMDEAERCHAIIYLYYGHIIAEGSVSEVIANSGLQTWSATGADVIGVMNELKSSPAVATVAPFGNVVHVSGVDGPALEQVIESYRERRGIQWSRTSPSLEDVFIYYMHNNGGRD